MPTFMWNFAKEETAECYSAGAERTRVWFGFRGSPIKINSE